MNGKTVETSRKRRGALYGLYVFTLIMITVSGFAQMPIFKRYYIADLPGLGWLARYEVTHLIHYLSAAFLIAIVSFRVSEYFLTPPRGPVLTASGYLRGGLLMGLIVSGALLTIRNLKVQPFSPETIVYLNLIHLLLVLIFLFTLLFCALLKKRWTKPVPLS